MADKKAECPIPQTHDRMGEAHHFLHEVLDNYHWPDEMRWNLNAFIQANRNVTFIMQKEMAQRPGFDDWYKQMQNRLNQDPLTKLMHDKRTFIVHQGNLKVNSRAQALVRDPSGNIGQLDEMPLSVDLESSRLLLWVRLNLPAQVPAEFEIGIRRFWFLEEIPSIEIGRLCGDGFTAVSDVVREAHRWLGFGLEVSMGCIHHITEITTMWESDLTPEGKRFYWSQVEHLRKKE